MTGILIPPPPVVAMDTLAALKQQISFSQHSTNVGAELKMPAHHCKNTKTQKNTIELQLLV